MNEPVMIRLDDGDTTILLPGHEYEFTWRVDGVQHYSRKSRGVFLGVDEPKGERLKFSFCGPNNADYGVYGGTSDFAPSFIIAIAEVERNEEARYAVRRA